MNFIGVVTPSEVSACGVVNNMVLSLVPALVEVRSPSVCLVVSSTQIFLLSVRFGLRSFKV